MNLISHDLKDLLLPAHVTSQHRQANWLLTSCLWGCVVFFVFNVSSCPARRALGAVMKRPISHEWERVSPSQCTCTHITSLVYRCIYRTRIHTERLKNEQNDGCYWESSNKCTAFHLILRHRVHTHFCPSPLRPTTPDPTDSLQSASGIQLAFGAGIRFTHSTVTVSAPPSAWEEQTHRRKGLSGLLLLF